MGTGYTRNDTPNNIADGNVINASDLDGEFDAIQSAFNGSTGHSHDGTTGEGPQIATAGLADNAVTTAKITDANVTTAKIADSNVTLAKMATNSVDSDQYVDGSIDTAHIGNLQVTTAKIAADAIDGTKLADNAVDSEHYTDGSIDRVHLAADIVDGTKIADDSIDSEHYVDGSIDTAHIADDAVTSAKLDTNIQIAGTLGVTGETTLTTHLNMGDSDIIKLGDSADLQIYHDGSNSYINDTGTGNLVLLATSFRLNNSADSQNMIVGTDNAEVSLFYAGSSKLNTKSDGVNITGELQSDSLDVDGATDISGQVNFHSNVVMDDNNKLIIGNGSDLQIYHDASNSYISDTGTGNLFVQASNNLILESATGENYLAGVANGSVTLYYDASPKIATTNTGIDVTGTATMDGLTVSGDVTLGNGATLNIDDQDSILFGTYSGGTSGTLLQGGTSTDYIVRVAGKLRQNISTGGDISFYEDTGTTPKLFWHASDERLGIGTASPTQILDVVASSANIRVAESGGGDLRMNVSGSTGAIGTFSNHPLLFRTNSTEVMRIDSSGNVGIGTTSPSSFNQYADNLVVGTTSGDNGITIASGTGNSGRFVFSDNATGAGSFVGAIEYSHSSDAMILYTATSERMRIDSSGNVGIGTTAPLSLSGNADPGLTIKSNGPYILLQDANNVNSIRYLANNGGTFNMGIVNDDGSGNKTEQFTLNSSGKCVMTGLAGSDYVLRVFSDRNNNDGYGIRTQVGTDAGTGTHYHIDFADGDDTLQGSITSDNGTVTYGAFTAHHPCIIPDADNDADSSDRAYPYGTLLEITSLSYTQKNGVDTERGILYNVQKSSSAKSKAVIGAYGSSMNSAGRGDTNLHQALILGDGHILCNNENGNIEIGDYICTSSTSGEGMKATSICTTIGIAREAVTFTDSTAVLVAVEYGYRQFVPEDLEARIVALETA